MNEHISDNELLRWLSLTTSSGAVSEEEQLFLDEIGAHAAGCTDCFDKMQAVRLVTAGLLRNTDLPVSGKETVDVGLLVNILVLRELLTGKTQVLAECTDPAADFVRAGSFETTRGEKDGGSHDDNDLLHVQMELKTDRDALTVRCERLPDSEDILLYAYSSSPLRMKLLCERGEIPPESTDYDPLLHEYIAVYRLNAETSAFCLCCDDE